MIALSKLSETATTVTLGWTPVPGCVGYRFTSSAMAKPSHTWDPARSNVRFSKADWYKVEALSVADVGEFPPLPGPDPDPFTRRKFGAIRYGSLPPPPGPERYDLFIVSWWETHQFRDLVAPTVLHYMSTASVGGHGEEIFNVSPAWARANGKILKDTNGADLLNVAYGWPVGDFGDAAFQAETVRTVTARLEQTGLEGVFFDDTPFHYHPLTRGPVPAKYPTQEAWWVAIVSFAKAMSAGLRPRFKVAYNCGGWFGAKAPGYDPTRIDPDKGDSDLIMYRDLAPYADAVFCEGYQTLLGQQGIRLAGAGWDRNWDAWQRLPRLCAELGVAFLGNAYMATATMADYVLCSLLLEADERATLIWDAGGGDPWHPFYERVRALGRATGTKRQNGNRWERPYEGGLVWVDPVAGTFGVV